MALLLAKFLHSIIAVHLLQGLPPKQSNGRPCPLWYVGFNGKKIKRIEELSGCGVRAITTGYVSSSAADHMLHLAKMPAGKSLAGIFLSEPDSAIASSPVSMAPPSFSFKDRRLFSYAMAE